MRIPRSLKICVLIAALCPYVFGQDTPGKSAPAGEGKGIPPRAAPADYQAHAPAGKVTVAAEFLGHSIPTSKGTLSTEDYVVVETALFGPPDARLKISYADFSLRVNEKKAPVPGQPFGVVFKSLKDPEWVPEGGAEAKSKSSFSTGGKAGQGDSTPAPVRMPIPLQRAMQERVQKAALPEGDRALPQAGLIFFPYHGKETSIHSLELTYAGEAGTATLTLQP